MVNVYRCDSTLIDCCAVLVLLAPLLSVTTKPIVYAPAFENVIVGLTPDKVLPSEEVHL